MKDSCDLAEIRRANRWQNDAFQLSNFGRFAKGVKFRQFDFENEGQGHQQFGCSLMVLSPLQMQAKNDTSKYNRYGAIVKQSNL